MPSRPRYTRARPGLTIAITIRGEVARVVFEQNVRDGAFAGPTGPGHVRFHIKLPSGARYEILREDAPAGGGGWAGEPDPGPPPASLGGRGDAGACPGGLDAGNVMAGRTGDPGGCRPTPRLAPMLRRAERG